MTLYIAIDMAKGTGWACKDSCNKLCKAHLSEAGWAAGEVPSAHFTPPFLDGLTADAACMALGVMPERLLLARILLWALGTPSCPVARCLPARALYRLACCLHTAPTVTSTGISYVYCCSNKDEPGDILAGL